MPQLNVSDRLSDGRQGGRVEKVEKILYVSELAEGYSPRVWGTESVTIGRGGLSVKCSLRVWG